ncbi:hypothetical protein OH76DRAFT_1367481, partial [Lentinus brumalis]
QMLATVPKAITEWNKTIRAEIEKVSTMQTSVRAYIFPVYGGRPRIILLPMLPSVTLEDGNKRRWDEDLDVRRWFPFGHKTERVNKLPDLECVLRNPFSILFSNLPHRTPFNDCLHTGRSLRFRGNVVVIRHHSRYTEDVTQMPSSDLTLVNIVLAT